MPEKTFEEALSDLMAQYRSASRDDLISALELAIYALKEDADED